MKYAIIMRIRDRFYLKGFTNTPIDDEQVDHHIYTKELKELNGLHIRLEGDAEMYIA